MQFHATLKEDIFQELASSEKGLTQREAENRIQKYGKNQLKKVYNLEPLKILLSQFQSFLIYILIIASIISFIIGHLTDAIVILVIVVVNASIGFFQQYKAEKAIISLRKLLVPTSTVIRDGKHIKISSKDLVPGDIIIFEAGDKINADCRILESNNLQTNEAVLTGESTPIGKQDKTIREKAILAERINMLYTGTQVVRGSGTAIVVATAMETEFGKIAEKLQEIKIQKTPIQKRLDLFSKQLGFIILALVLIIVIVGFFTAADKIDTFLTAVALAVSAIPEGLPAVLAIAFAISSMFMSKKNVVVRKLPAVESLGSVTVICSDKTGTLTEEKMHVQEIFSNNISYIKKGKNILLNEKSVDVKNNLELAQLIKASLLCNNARFEEEGLNYSFIGDPTEESFIRLALDLDISKKKITEKEPRIKEFEFNSERKMMSILRDSGRNNTLYSKGASEKIISLCAFELVKGEIKRLSETRKKQLLKQSYELEKKALRVLGFAYKNFSKREKVQENGLIFLGLMGMLDPPRPEVKNAIQQCKDAGIKVKIITGDSALTASAIANKIGIFGKIIVGSELEKMSEEQLEKQIGDIAIFARTTPEQKLKITTVLQKKGETVAITGDGVNDVLALKSADIGIAMGIRGTDVARDVSDIILLDDNFASIVEGVKEGRKTYDNIKKFTKYLLAVNFSEIFLILLALTMRFPLPLLPLQILWINLMTDSLPALSLVFEKEENVMKTKPRREKSILSGIWGFILIGGVLALLAEFIVFFFSYSNSLPIEEVRTMVLTTAILFELFFIYTCRSNRPLLRKGMFSNKWLNLAVLISLGFHLTLLYTPLGALFGVVSLTLKDWLFVLPFSLSGLIIFEIGKYIRLKK